MTANERVNEVLETLIKEVNYHCKDAENFQKDPKNKDWYDFYKGELFAYDAVLSLIADHLIDDDNL